MGGNALKNTFTRRYEKQEYHSLVGEVTSMLNTLFPSIRVEAIKAYQDKESFGDMDVLIESDNLPSNWTSTLVEYSNTKEFVSNGDVFSFEYKELQIDLIKSKSESFDFSSVYFSYNDLGNLMGRIAHKMGLKFGHKGLSYVLRDKEKVIKEIVLSTYAEESMIFLGYDFKRHQQGFKTLVDVFEFAVSTPYFNSEIYLLDNMNHKSRTRDAKRKTYNEFLSWLESEYSKRKIPPYHFNKDKSYFAPIIETYFPNSINLVSQAIVEHAKTLEFRNKFNGNVIMDLTKLQGKELGNFIKSVIEANGGEDKFKDKVLGLSDLEVRELITSEFNKTTNPIDKLKNMFESI